MTIFDAASKGDNNKIIELLSKGVDINIRYGEYQATAIYVATYNNLSSTVDLLIENGADVNIPSVSKVTPLYIASQRCFPSITQSLLGAGANIENGAEDPIQKHQLFTPLYAAISSLCYKTVEMLLKAGALTSSEMIDTPVLLATSHESESIKYKKISIPYNLFSLISKIKSAGKIVRYKLQKNDPKGHAELEILIDEKNWGQIQKLMSETNEKSYAS